MALASLLPVLASSSAVGKAVKVAATATAGTALHATGISATIIDIVSIWAYNSEATTARVLTIEWGGVTSPDDLTILSIPARVGWVPVILGRRIAGTGAAASTVAAFASTTNVIMCYIDVDRYTPAS